MGQGTGNVFEVRRAREQRQSESSSSSGESFLRPQADANLAALDEQYFWCSYHHYCLLTLRLLAVSLSPCPEDPNYASSFSFVCHIDSTGLILSIAVSFHDFFSGILRDILARRVL